MKDIELIEAARGGPFIVLFQGERLTLPDPADMDFQVVLAALSLEHAPETPGGISESARAETFRRWSAHYDLPDFQNAQRLTYLVDHYQSAIVYDLRHFCSGADLGYLWRSRQWRTLLDLIDHLPGHSWYSSAVSNDEEHAKMLAESLAAAKSDGERSKPSTPMTSWTPEVSIIAELIEEVRLGNFLLRAVNGDKSAPKPESYPRPLSPLQAAMKRAEAARRREAHESLAMRILPHKRRQRAEQQR